MGRKSAETIKNAKVPKHMAEIGMTSEQYYELKVYIKSIVLPGTPAFESKRSGKTGSKQIYNKWLNNVLEEVGPRYFPGGGKGLAWPEDRDEIYKAIHQVVRILSIGIRRSYKKRELRTGHGEAGHEEMGVAYGGAPHEGMNVDHTGAADVKENFMMPDEGGEYLQWEKEEDNLMALMETMGKENPPNNTMEETTGAEPI